MTRKFFTVAPMMDWTDRHCRAFHRVLSRRARLYTEMVTTGAVIHGPRERLLGFSDPEHPVAVQLGGSDPADLAQAVILLAARYYDDRSQDGLRHALPFGVSALIERWRAVRTLAGRGSREWR